MLKETTGALTGLEHTTFTLRVRRATHCATPPYKLYLPWFKWPTPIACVDDWKVGVCLLCNLNNEVKQKIMKLYHMSDGVISRTFHVLFVWLI